MSPRKMSRSGPEPDVVAFAAAAAACGAGHQWQEATEPGAEIWNADVVRHDNSLGS